MGNGQTNTWNAQMRTLGMASLAGAIINQAINDYASNSKELTQSAEMFFADPWFDQLCGNLDSSIFLAEAKRRREAALTKKGVVA